MKSKRFFSYALAFILLISCTPDSGVPPDNVEPVLPKAEFSAAERELETGDSTLFTDASENATGHEWTFEGGEPASSSVTDPEVTYSTAGTFSVTLKVTNADGEDSKTKSDYITVVEPDAPPTAAFSAAETTIEEGQSIDFSDESTNLPTAWSWVFEGGDPATSTDQNPTVTYATAGTYAVSLTATNADGEDVEGKTDYITVIEPGTPPTGEFSASETTVKEGESIDFSDESTGLPTAWAWTFEGGDPSTSTDQNPTVTYAAEGTYAVTLTVTNANGEDTETKTDYITVTREPTPPSAAFTQSATTIEAGQTIDFTDESTNAPTSWAWVFDGGDPATSTDQNPTVTYATAGTYTVTLTATNDDGEDTETKTDLITVTEPVIIPDADFTASATTITTAQSITFTDTSTNIPISWAWAFEGGSPATSTDQNPVVSYTTAGTYEVSLTATNAAGSDTETKMGFITVNQQTASYTVTFMGNWTASDHPTDFPTGQDHFSPAVGMVHQTGIRFFEEGQLASTGIENMAENGSNTVLASEIQTLINAGNASVYLNGGTSLPNGTAAQSITFNVTEEFSIVTLVSMIAPSPDWFVAAEDVDLFQNGAFVNSITVNGVSYDSGTDSGTTFTSANADTNPAEPIFKITGTPLGNGTTVDPPMAFFTFVKN